MSAVELSIAYELYMKPHEIDTDTAMSITSAAGFKYVDMSVGPFCLNERSPILKPDWEKWAEKTVETANKHGLNMLQAHCLLFNYMDKNAPDYQYLTDVNLKLLDVCKALGIEYFIVHPGTENVSMKKSLEKSREWLLPFVEKAEKLGLKICIENIFEGLYDECICRAFGSRPDELAELIDSFGSNNVGACWDCGHAHVGRLNQKASLMILGDRVWTTHVHDNRGRYANDLHLPPFYGSLNWQSFMSGLSAIDYKGTLNFEIEPHTVPMDFMLEEFKSVYKKGERLLAML